MSFNKKVTSFLNATLQRKSEIINECDEIFTELGITREDHKNIIIGIAKDYQSRTKHLENDFGYKNIGYYNTGSEEYALQIESFLIDELGFIADIKSGEEKSKYLYFVRMGCYENN